LRSCSVNIFNGMLTRY